MLQRSRSSRSRSKLRRTFSSFDFWSLVIAFLSLIVALIQLGRA